MAVGGWTPLVEQLRQRENAANLRGFVLVRVATIVSYQYSQTGLSDLSHASLYVAGFVFRQRLRDISVFPFLQTHHHMTRVLLLQFITTVLLFARL